MRIDIDFTNDQYSIAFRVNRDVGDPRPLKHRMEQSKCVTQSCFSTAFCSPQASYDELTKAPRKNVLIARADSLVQVMLDQKDHGTHEQYYCNNCEMQMTCREISEILGHSRHFFWL